MQVRFGALCPPLAEQLRAFPFPPGALDHFQRDADAITRLSVRGLLPAGQVNQARWKLMMRLRESMLTTDGEA